MERRKELDYMKENNSLLSTSPAALCVCTYGGVEPKGTRGRKAIVVLLLFTVLYCSFALFCIILTAARLSRRI
jgi:hypothetical protein